MKKIFLVIILILLNNILYAAEFRGSFFQGNLIIGKVEKGTKVFVDKKKLKFQTKVFLFLV